MRNGARSGFPSAPLGWALAVAIVTGGCGDDTVPTASGAGGSATSAEASTAQAGGGTPASTAAASGGGGGVAETVSLLAWNVESFPKTSAAPGVVQQVIADLRPTIAAFEEVDDLEALEQALDASGDYALVATNDPPFTTLVAVDTRMAAIVDWAEIFGDESYAFPRAPVVARVELLATGEQLDVMALHLKALIDEESEERRRLANGRLVTWCEARHALFGTPIVLLGDFNDELRDPAAENVFQAYRDATEPTFVLLTEPPEANGEFTFVPFRAFIDHAIATAPLRHRWPDAKARVLPLDEDVARYVADVSDHRPIVVDLGAL